jgi:hypothetical protein
MMERILVKNKLTGESKVKHVLNKNRKCDLWLEVAQDELLWQWHIDKQKSPGLNVPPLTRTDQDIHKIIDQTITMIRHHHHHHQSPTTEIREERRQNRTCTTPSPTASPTRTTP